MNRAEDYRLYKDKVAWEEHLKERLSSTIFYLCTSTGRSEDICKELKPIIEKIWYESDDKFSLWSDFYEDYIALHALASDTLFGSEYTGDPWRHEEKSYELFNEVFNIQFHLKNIWLKCNSEYLEMKKKYLIGKRDSVDEDSMKAILEKVSNKFNLGKIAGQEYFPWDFR